MNDVVIYKFVDLSLISPCDDEKEEKLLEKTESELEKEKQRERLRLKVKSVSKMLRMYSILCKERETLMQIKSFTPENKIPPGLLSQGVDAIRLALGDFEKAKSVDKVNEKRPQLENQPPQQNSKLLSLRLSQGEIKDKSTNL